MSEPSRKQGGVLPCQCSWKRTSRFAPQRCGDTLRSRRPIHLVGEQTGDSDCSAATSRTYQLPMRLPLRCTLQGDPPQNLKPVMHLPKSKVQGQVDHGMADWIILLSHGFQIFVENSDEDVGWRTLDTDDGNFHVLLRTKYIFVFNTGLVPFLWEMA